MDIGHDSIKMVEAELGPRGLTILALGSTPTPPHSVSEGQVVAIDQVSSAIRDLVDSAGIRANQVVASAVGHSVVVRTIRLPRMSEANLKRTIPWEAKKYFNFNPEDTVLECAVVDAPELARSTEMEVIVVAAPKALVDSRVAALEAARLEPIVVDVASLACMRAVVPQRRDGTNTVALVDLGSAYTDVTMTINGRHTFQRTIPIGGSTITNTIASTLGLSQEQTVSAKHALTASDLEAVSPGIRDPASIARSVMDDILREIRRTVNFYQSQFPEGAPEASIDAVLLCGGGANIPGIAGFFSKVLELPVEIARVRDAIIEGVAPDAQNLWDRLAPAFVHAVGLAAWELVSRRKVLAEV
ncbi:MAG: type IV pilus assembly protein PilM [Armatimonadota bacterium]